MNDFIYGKMSRYQVVAACTVVKHGASDKYFYRGAILPMGLPMHQIEHLLKVGHIREIGAQS